MSSRLLVAIFACVLPAFGSDCPTTRPPKPRFIPPAPQPANLSRSFWYGTNGLFTALDVTGTWKVLNEKLFLWSKDYNRQKESTPPLIVTAKRLDGNSPPVAGLNPTNAGMPDGTAAMLVGIELPTAGCWEITSRYRKQILTFVVAVNP